MKRYITSSTNHRGTYLNWEERYSSERYMYYYCSDLLLSVPYYSVRTQYNGLRKYRAVPLFVVKENAYSYSVLRRDINGRESEIGETDSLEEAFKVAESAYASKKSYYEDLVKSGLAGYDRTKLEKRPSEDVDFEQYRR